MRFLYIELHRYLPSPPVISRHLPMCMQVRFLYIELHPSFAFGAMPLVLGTRAPPWPKTWP